MRGGSLGGGLRLAVVAAAAAAGAGVSVRFGQGESLSPTGQRERRIFGYENIRRHLQRQKRTWGASGSLAGHPHEHKREIARRLRQQARDAERQAARVTHGDLTFMPEGCTGISRRGRFVVA